MANLKVINMRNIKDFDKYKKDSQIVSDYFFKITKLEGQLRQVNFKLKKYVTEKSHFKKAIELENKALELKQMIEVIKIEQNKFTLYFEIEYPKAEFKILDLGDSVQKWYDQGRKDGVKINE